MGAALVILGFILFEVDWRFLTLCALGTFGPGILREWGWVKDKDEFQMRAIHRAGYHAGRSNPDQPAEPRSGLLPPHGVPRR